MDNEVNHLLEFGEFRIDPEQRLLFRHQEPVPLTPKAFDLLCVLVQRSGKVVLKDDLMKILWPDTFVEESNLGQHVSQLRKALGERAQSSSYIVTVPGRGYRFASEVRALPREGESIIVATRSRVVIEEGTSGRKVDPVSELARFPDRESKALPGAVGQPQRGRIASLVLLAAVMSALAMWFFLRPVPVPRVARTVQLTHTGRVEPFGPAFTDGSRVLFAERFGGTQSLAQVAEQGGEPALVSTSVPSIELYDIDRRHSRMLVASPGSTDTPYPLWIVPTATGSARRVGDILARYAAWSPDGQQIAFAAGGDLSIVGEDGLQPHKVFTAPGVIGFIRWSPDGGHLSLTVRSTSTGTASLWEVAPDGRDGHALSLPFPGKAPAGWGAGECCGDWSPDGKYFLFRSYRDGVTSLWMTPTENNWVHRGTNQPVQLYTTPNRINEPRFSADGRKILFVNYQEKRELVRYDSVRKLFVPYLGGIPARHVSFARDGQWVAYKNQLDGCLWRSRVDGTQALQLTFPPIDVYHSTWSPDGKTIAFEGSGRLYTIPFDGGTPQRLLPEEVAGGQPSWSPDGKALVFTDWNSSTRDAIAVLDLTTRQIQMVPASENFEGPQWSPDGKYIVAGSIKDKKLMLFDLERRRWSELAEGAPYGWGIRWSSDSKYVYYQHVFAGEQPIFRVRLSDRTVEQVTSSRQILRADVLSYSMTGLTPDNSPLASLVHTNSDVYALELDLP